MTARATAVELLTRRLHDVRDVLRVLGYVEPSELTWPVTLQLNLMDGFARRDRSVGLAPSLRDIEEALGLLAMLRALDHDLWVTHMLEIWPKVPKERLDSGGERAGEMWGVVLRVGIEHGFTELHECRRSRLERGPSTTYHEALGLVRRVRGTDTDSWSPKISVHLIMTRGRAVVTTLDLLAEIHAKYCRENPAPIFYFAAACLMVRPLTFSIQELAKIESLHEKGLLFYAYHIDCWELPCSVEYKLPLFKVLQRMFAASLSARHASDNFGVGTKDLMISNTTPSYWIPALLSAAHSSQSLRSIRVENSFAELRQDNRLAWIIFAVFRRRNSLESFQLNCVDLEERDVSQIGALLTVETPVSMLINGTHAVDRVVASRFHLRGAASCDDDEEYTSAEPLVVDVVDGGEGNDSKLRVLLPGYGEAWVHRESVQETIREKNSSTELAAFGPRFIFLRGVSVTSSEAVLLLLPNILPGAKCLMVEFSNDVGARLSQEWLARLVCISSTLTELTIHARVFTNLDAIVDGFAARALHLTKLDIENVLCRDSSQLERFFDALSDHHHPMASQLRELRLVVVVDTVEGAGFVDSIKRMLVRNQHLTEFKIRIQTVRRAQIPTSVFNPIREENGEDSMVIPLQIRKKLAFLSVVATASASCRSVRGLNESVIMAIFEFSVATLKRKVEVEIVNTTARVIEN